MIITAGKVDVTVPVYFVDDDGGTAPGEPTTGLAFGDIETVVSASYQRQGAARVDFALVTQTPAGAHTDGGFVLIDDTNMPGLYRLDVPDAAFISGVDFVIIQLVAAVGNNTVMRPIEVIISAMDLQDAVRGGMTALPNVVAEGAGGLYTRGIGVGQINQAANGQTDANVVRLNNVAQSLLDLKDLADDGYDPATDKIQGVVLADTTTTLTNKTGFSLAATGLDAIVAAATGMVEIAKAVWDRVLSGATHNIVNSAGRRLRQIEAAFVLASGTAQAGTPTTITLAASESATDNIFNGDRVVIVGGTGLSEHGIIVSYDGTTKIATMSQSWVITPDATSEYDLVPADVDIETIENSAKAAIGLAASAATIVKGTVDTTAFTPTTTEFEADDITVAGADHFNGRQIIFTDPALQDQATKITDYVLTGGRGHFTVVALSAAPADDDTFIII